MTYSPGNPGYPSAQPAGSYPGATPSFAKDAGESKLPFFLAIAMAVLGLLVYVFNFFPTFVLSADLGPAAGGRAGDAGTAVAVAVLAALLAGLSLLPKTKINTGIVAAIAVLGALLVIAEMINTPDRFLDRLGVVAPAGCQRVPGLRRRRRGPAGGGRHHRSGATAQVRPLRAIRRRRLRAVRPVRATTAVVLRSAVRTAATATPAAHAAVAAVWGAAVRRLRFQSCSEPEHDADPVRDSDHRRIRCPVRAAVGTAARGAVRTPPSVRGRFLDPAHRIPQLQPATLGERGRALRRPGAAGAVVGNRAGVVITVGSRACDSGAGQSGSGRSPGA